MWFEWPSAPTAGGINVKERRNVEERRFSAALCDVGNWASAPVFDSASLHQKAITAAKAVPALISLSRPWKGRSSTFVGSRSHSSTRRLKRSR